MNYKRALENYERLFRRFGPCCVDTQLSDVAEIVFCSPRHARNLLHQLTDMDWIDWQAAPGRGKRAKITCKIEPTDACYQLVDQLMAQGKTEAAIKLMDFNDRKLSTELQHYLASSLDRSQSAIRIPFHRQLKSLHPHLAFERTERHLILQIFQRLTQYKNDKVMPDLAHHWWSNSTGDEWTFHLRPSVFFHNQSELSAKDIKASLLWLARRPFWQQLYGHITGIDIISSTTVTIRLSHPDWCLPRLLARPEASIMSSATINAATVQDGPVGSGPFFPDVVSTRMLRLKRNPSYVGQLALAPVIEIWFHNEWEDLKECREHLIFLEQHQPVYTVSRSGGGIFYMLTTNRECRDNPVIADIGGLLLGNPADKPIKGNIHIAVENNNDGRKQAEEIKAAQDSDSELTFSSRCINDSNSSEDVLLGAIRTEGCKITSLRYFFQCDMNWQAILTEAEYQLFRSQLLETQLQPIEKKALDMLVGLLDWLEEIKVIRRLNAKGFSITAPIKLQGLEVNHVGWCDFSTLWINDTPEQTALVQTV